MFLPDPDSWPYTNYLESIYRGNSTDMVPDSTLSKIAAAYRAREERRVVEGWAAPTNEQEQEQDKSETKETRRKLPERALKILHLFFQNISPSPSPAQQTDLLTYIHTSIPGAEWFGPNNLRAWFIARRSEGTARRLLDEVAGQGLRRREEQRLQVQVRAQERQLVRRQRSDEKDIVTCESILYPTLSPPKISKLAILYRNNTTPNKNAIEVWARALKSDVEDVRNWVQMNGGGGGIPVEHPPVPQAVSSHPQNLSTKDFPERIVQQHTPIPWWSSTTPPPPAPPPPPPPPSTHSSPSTPPTPRLQYVHEAETSHIPYRRHPTVPHHDLRTQYRGAAAPRRASSPYGRVYRSPVEVSPTATATTATSGRPRRPLPFSDSSVRPSSLPSHHTNTNTALGGRNDEDGGEGVRQSSSSRRGGQIRAIRSRPTSSTPSSPSSGLPDERELFNPATLRDLVSVPAQYRQPWSRTQPHILPPSHPRRPTRPYPHLLRHILAHSHSHSHDFNQETSRQTSESPVVDHDKEYEYTSAARSSLSAVVPPSFDLGPSVFSPSSLHARSSSVVFDLTGPDDDDGDMGVPIDSETEESAKALPPASTHTVFAEPSSTYSDKEDDEGEPMGLESDDDDDAPPTSQLQLHHHIRKHVEPELKVRRNLLAELATFVDQRLAHYGEDVGLAKGQQFDFDVAFGVCEAFYERIQSGVYRGVGRGLVLREVDLY